MTRGTKGFVTCQSRMYVPREQSHLAYSKRPQVIIVRVERSQTSDELVWPRGLTLLLTTNEASCTRLFIMSRSGQVHGQDNYCKLSQDTCRNAHVGIEPTLPSTEHWDMHHSARVHTAPPLATLISWSFIVSVLCTTKSGTLYLLVIDVFYGCVMSWEITRF